jgi:Flp pilus assembly secretin CpaC
VSLTPVGSANPVIRQDQAGIILTVIPRVSPTDEITIDVQAEKSEFQTGPGSGIPIFTDATNGNVIEAPIKNVSKVDTMVSCISGQTIVLGGMITKGQSKLERKVPVLGDLPFIGWLFRYDNQQTQRKELLIFLTPHVVRHPSVSDAQSVTEANRIHFPHADAAQIHGQCPTPPNPDEPRGIEFPERHYERWWERKQRRREAHQAKPPMFQTPAAPEPMGHEGWMLPYDSLPTTLNPSDPPVVPGIELGPS